MKRLVAWMLALLLPILVVGTVQTRTLSGSASAALAGRAEVPAVGTIRPAQGSSLPAVHEEPIEMPDLLGRSLEFATGIWDDDEPLPQIVVERLSDGPD